MLASFFPRIGSSKLITLEVAKHSNEHRYSTSVLLFMDKILHQLIYVHMLDIATTSQCCELDLPKCCKMFAHQWYIGTSTYNRGTAWIAPLAVLFLMCDQSILINACKLLSQVPHVLLHSDKSQTNSSLKGWTVEHTKSVTTLNMLHCSWSHPIQHLVSRNSCLWSVQLPTPKSPHKDTCLLWCAWLNLLPTFAPDWWAKNIIRQSFWRCHLQQAWSAEIHGYEEVKGRPWFIQSNLWTKEKAFIIASRLLPQAFQPFHVAKVSKLKLLLHTTGTVQKKIKSWQEWQHDINLSCRSPKRLTTSLQRLPHKTDTAKSQIQWTPKTSWTSSETKKQTNVMAFNFMTPPTYSIPVIYVVVDAFNPSRNYCEIKLEISPKRVEINKHMGRN